MAKSKVAGCGCRAGNKSLLKGKSNFFQAPLKIDWIAGEAASHVELLEGESMAERCSGIKIS